MRRAIIAALVAAALAALSACAGDGVTQEQQPPPSPAVPRVGVAGSGCELPVSFALAESWKPKAVTVQEGDALAELARRGPLTMKCEIDAKPAGHLGFLRVWTGDKGELRPALEAFIGAKALEAVYTDLRVGDRNGLEVAYWQKSELDEGELDKERAFAVETSQGIAAVSLDSLDSDEHKDMLPAYELAKSTLR